MPSDPPAWDDLATWTGSVIRHPDSSWRMFYTGVSRADDGLVQRIGVAASTDLSTWHKDPDAVWLTADPRWYETLDLKTWPEQAWRDPWVYADPDGDGWHLLVTARARTGPADQRGVIGHARSADLLTWDVQPPLSEPGAGFGQLEVPQVEVVDGRAVLIFSCLRPELAGNRKQGTGGVWIAPAASVTGPFDIAAAQPLTDDRRYAGRIIRDRSGSWVLLAFHHTGPDGQFRGGLADPVPLMLSRRSR